MWATALFFAMGWIDAGVLVAAGLGQAGAQDKQELKVIAKAAWSYGSAKPDGDAALPPTSELVKPRVARSA